MILFNIIKTHFFNKKYVIAATLFVALLVASLPFILASQNKVLAATFTVTKTADTNDGTCDADCSLREAITATNSNPGADSIAFNIPASDPGYNATEGWWLLELESTLPIIVEQITIDGTTQTDYAGNTNTSILGTGGTVGVDNLLLDTVDGPEIVITRSGLITSLSQGLQIIGTTTNGSIIRGLAMYGFGPTTVSGISANGTIVISNAQNVLIEGNVLCTDPDDMNSAPLVSNANCISASGNSSGLIIQNNIFASGSAGGVFLVNSSENTDVTNVTVQNNEFYNMFNTAAVNSIEVQSNVSTGGPFVFDAEISGNLFNFNNAREQLDLVASNSDYISVDVVNNNIINSNVAAPITPAIRIRDGIGCLVSKNIIQNNESAGIIVSTITAPSSVIYGSNNRITQNIFGGNGALAIDLCAACSATAGGDGVTANNGTYTNSVGNRGIDHPVITSATIINSNELYVTGTAFADTTIEVYGTNSADPTGYGEGDIYLGSLLADGSGNIAGTVDIASTGFTSTSQVTATATDVDGNTSEFGPNFSAIEEAGISLIKSIGEVTYNGDGSFSTTFTLTAANEAQLDLENLQITDDLEAVFATDTTFEVVSITSSDFTVNNLFNGTSDINLLTGTDTLAVAESGTITLSIKFSPGQNAPANFLNSARASSFTATSILVEDFSHPSSNLLNGGTLVTYDGSLIETGTPVSTVLILIATTLLFLFKKELIQLIQKLNWLGDYNKSFAGK